MIKLIIFDFDGTLVDSSKDIVIATNELLSLHELDELTQEEILPFISHGFSGFLSHQFGKKIIDPHFIETLRTDFTKIYKKHYLNNMKLMPGALEVLNKWKGLKAIVTNKSEAKTKAMISKLPLKDFDWVEIFGWDSFEFHKPHPLPLIKILELANLEPHEALMVGDGLPDIEAARQAGMESVAIDFGFTPMNELNKAQPDHVISNYTDLFSIIEKFNSLS